MLALSFPGEGQVKLSRDQYVELYADLAMKEMVRTGIPASIKLAQACLESDNGNSRLALDAKNHFGIKCHDWTGRRVRHDDDERNECFRKYRSVHESFMDHSDFLTTKQRYSALFSLKQDDFKGWARGLKEAGYATSPTYAELLIKIIEDNELYLYDQMVLKGRRVPGPGVDPVKPLEHRQVLTNNRIEYIVVEPGDTPESLRELMDMYPREIYRYNNISKEALLEPGMVIYLQPKRYRAEKGKEVHVVKEGETMWDISQLYGVKLNRLYKRNNMSQDSAVQPGDQVWLRKRKPADPTEQVIPKESSEEPTEMEFEFDPS
ncbi:MAG: glucosaminidase domain-containing protein [Bacteroidales bacterium]